MDVGSLLGLMVLVFKSGVVLSDDEDIALVVEVNWGVFLVVLIDSFVVLVGLRVDVLVKCWVDVFV